MTRMIFGWLMKHPKIELLTIAIAMLSLMVSAINAYFQFLYKPKRVRLMVLSSEDPSEPTIKFIICNGGTENVYIGFVQLLFVRNNEKNKHHFIKKIQEHNSSVLLSKGQIKEFEILPKSLTEIVGQDTTSISDGTYVFDVSLFVQMAFPDGSVYNQYIKVGKCEYGKDKGLIKYTRHGVDIDLMKGAIDARNSGGIAEYRFRTQGQ